MPSDFVEKYSWDNPTPGSESAEFKDYVLRWIPSQLYHARSFRITDDGLDAFVRGWHVEAP